MDSSLELEGRESKCKPRLLSAYIEGQLADSAIKLYLIAHIESCQKCWDQLYRARVSETAAAGGYASGSQSAITKVPLSWRKGASRH